MQFTSELMTVSLEDFSLGRHLLQSADKHPNHDDEDMSLWKTCSVILSKTPSSNSEGKERLECLVQGKHRDSRNA